LTDAAPHGENMPHNPARCNAPYKVQGNQLLTHALPQAWKLEIDFAISPCPKPVIITIKEMENQWENDFE
jgi:hypothetical protein